MSGPLARAGAFFLAPQAAADASPSPAVASSPPVALAAVVCAPADARAVAGGLAAALRRTAGARTAVTCVAQHDDRLAPAARAPADRDDGAHDRPSPEPGPTPGPASRAASKLARRLAAHDLRAAAAGALCHITLAPEPEPAIRDVWRTLAVAGDAPVVVALCERSDAIDAFLAQADALFLATAGEDDYVGLALDSLARLGPPVARLRPPASALGRHAARFGLRRVPTEAPA